MLIALLICSVLTSTSAAFSIHFSDGPRDITASDEMRHYGDEYWVYISLHPTSVNTEPLFIYMGPETGTPSATLSPDGRTVTLKTKYLQTEIDVANRFQRIKVLEVHPFFIGVQQGDVIEHQSLSTRPYWYNLGVDKNFGQMIKVNGYEDHGIFSLIRGGVVILKDQILDYEHAWGDNLKNGMYNNGVVYESWGSFVARNNDGKDLLIGIVWWVKTDTGEEWQDGFLRFLDDGVYHRIGTTIGGSSYSVEDISTKCDEFLLAIPTPRGQLSMHLLPNQQKLVRKNVDACTYQFVMHDIEGTLGTELIKGRITWETQRKSPIPKEDLKATTLSISTSPNPSLLGEEVTVSGRLTDQASNGMSGKPITIQFSLDNIAWSTAAKVSTYPNGTYSYKAKGNTAGSFYVRSVFPGDSTFAGSTSPVIVHTTKP